MVHCADDKYCTGALIAHVGSSPRFCFHNPARNSPFIADLLQVRSTPHRLAYRTCYTPGSATATGW